MKNLNRGVSQTPSSVRVFSVILHILPDMYLISQDPPVPHHTAGQAITSPYPDYMYLTY